jgi:hypothetical protein
MTFKRLYVAFVLMALGAVLAACNNNSGATTVPAVTAGEATATQQPDAGTPVAETTVAPDVLVKYQKSGGLAGILTVLTVKKDGETVRTDRAQTIKQGKLTDDELNLVNQQLNAVRKLTNLQASYDQGGVADDIYQTVIFDQNGTTLSVTVAQVGSKGTAPPDLQALIGTLDGLLSNK